MSDSEYLILFSPTNLKSLKKNFFSEFEGFYNGSNYIFPIRKEKKLQELLVEFPQLKLVRQPLPRFHTFESICHAHNLSYLTSLLFKVEIQILKIQKEKELENGNFKKQINEKLEKLIAKQEKIKEKIESLKNLEKNLSYCHSPSIPDVQFIGQMKVNFLSDQPSEMPRLINFIDEQGSVYPLIRRGITAMLAGAGGSGKTHLLAQLAISIAFGEPWLGFYPVEEKGNVFLGIGENDDEDIHRLMSKIFKKTSKETTSQHSFSEACNRLAITSFSGKNAAFLVKEQATPFYEKLLYHLKQKEPATGWSCLIFDPISRFLGPDVEANNASATNFISLLEKMIAELKGKPTILFGHHMNKNSFGHFHTDQGSARGSSALTDGVRWQANLEKQKGEDKLNKVVFRVVKTNFTPIIPPQILERDPSGVLQVEKWGFKKEYKEVTEDIRKESYPPEELLQKYGVFGIR